MATGFDKAREQKKDDEEKNNYIRKLWEMYYPEPNPLKSAEPDPQESGNSNEDESAKDNSEIKEKGNVSGWKEKGQSWFNSLVEFVKHTLEEE